MGIDISGKNVLITGANRGIGKAIVDSCIASGAGKIYAAVRDVSSAQPLVDQYGDKVQPVALDLSKPETITAAASTASDVDVVISNAGVLKTASPLDADAIEALEFEININVIGLLRMAQAFAPVLKANGGGAFVQLNSVASLRAFPAFATYAASKAAAYSITQALRDVLKENGTQVLSVHPGPIATDMGSDAGFDDIAEPASLVGDGIVAALKSGDFRLYPDSMAKQVGEAYASFAANVVDSE